jgi:hypothetical protein
MAYVSFTERRNNEAIALPILAQAALQGAGRSAKLERPGVGGLQGRETELRRDQRARNCLRSRQLRVSGADESRGE